jgi:hypothetical protein
MRDGKGVHDTRNAESRGKDSKANRYGKVRGEKSEEVNKIQGKKNRTRCRDEELKDIEWTGMKYRRDEG